MNRLNLIIDFVEGMMKKLFETMKHGFLSGFAILFLLLIAIPINAQVPQKVDGYWFSAYDATEKSAYAATSSGGEKSIGTYHFTSFAQPVSSLAHCQVKKGTLNSGYSIKVKESNDGVTYSDYIASWGQSELNTDYKSKIFGITLHNYLYFHRTKGVGTASVQHVGILLNPHIFIEPGGAGKSDDIYVSSCSPGYATTTIHPYSFLTYTEDGYENLTIEIEDDPSGFFSCSTEGGNVGKYTCGYPNCDNTSGFVNRSSVSFNITYTPTAYGTHTAKFRVYNGPEGARVASDLITITGHCSVVQPTISWKTTLPSLTTTTSATQYKLSDYLDITNCQYGDLKFSYSDADVISIYQNTTDQQYYFQVKSGNTGHYTTNIKAEIECNNRGMFAASATSADITVSKVALPSITWTPATAVNKGETKTLDAPTLSPSSANYSTTTYSANHTNVAITGNQAKFNQTGLYDLKVCVSESKAYNDACSSNVPFKVNFANFGETELGSNSDSQTFTISDSRYTSGNLTIQTTGEFKVRASESDSWSQNITINLANTKIFYVCFVPTVVPSLDDPSSFNRSGSIKITLGSLSESFTVNGKVTWEKMTFAGTTYIGYASAYQTSNFSGLCNVTVPNGYLVSTNGTTWADGLSGVNVSSKLYVKYQPNDAEDGDFVIINYGANYSQTKRINVTGTKARYTITPAGTKIGLASDKKVTLDNFTVLNSNATIKILSKNSNNPDYYLSVANVSTDKASENPSDWKKTGVSATLSSKQFFLKFQPSDAAANRVCDIKIVDGGKEYTIQASGTGVKHVKDFGTSPYVGHGSYHGFSYIKNNATVDISWYYFQNNSSKSDEFNKLEATFIVEGFAATPAVKPTVTILKNSGTQNLDFALNTNNYDCGYSVTMNSYTSIVRVGFTPRTAITNSSCDVRISANGKKYTYTVKGSATEQTATLSNSVKIGQASAYQKFTISAMFRPSWGNNAGYTAEAAQHILYSEDQTTWTETLTIPNCTTARTFYVKLVPEAVSNPNTTYSFYIKDNGTSNRGRYKFNVIGTAEASSKSFTSRIGSPSTSEQFIMSNFTPAGQVKVNAPADFAVSADNSTFSSSIDLNAGTNTFWIRQEAVNQSCNLSGVVKIIDQTTTREYPISVTSTVDKKKSSIEKNRNRVDFFSGDYTTHIMVGSNIYFKGVPSDIEPEIFLTIPSQDDNNYLERVDNNKLRIKQGVTVTSNVDCNIYANFSGNDEYEGATAEMIVVRIHPVREINNDPAWVYNTSTSKWYVYQVENLDLGSVTVTDNAINLYLPNVSCTSNYFALKNSPIDARCPFATALYSNNAPTDLVTIRGVTSNDYDDNHVDFDIPAKGDDAKLYTRTNKFDNSQCDPNTGNVRQKYAKIEIEVPEHYHKLKRSESVNFGDVQVGEVAYKDIPIDGLFKSFMTSGNGLRIVPVSGCPTAFFVNSENENQQMTLVPGNSVISPYNKLSANSGLVVDKVGNYYIRLYFKPTAAGQISGAFTLTDDNLSLPISVTGEGKVSANEPQTIIWDQDLSNLQASSGSGDVTLSAVSSSGMNVTYSQPTNQSGGNFSIDNTTKKLSFSNVTDVATCTVTANCVAGAKNGVNYAAAEPVSRTITVYNGAQTLTECSAITLDASGWSAESSLGASSLYDPADNPITLPVTFRGSKLRFTVSPHNCPTNTLTIYLNGTGSTDTKYVFTNTGAATHEIDLNGEAVTRLFCSFSGSRTDASWSSRMSYSITDLTLTGSVWKPVSYDNPIGFGTQRVGQGGATRNIKAAAFTYLKGNVVASITGTDADCFSIISTAENPNPLTANCNVGVAAFNVRFIPTKYSASALNANLVVTNQYGETSTVQLQGNATKRDLKIKWGYAAAQTSYNIDAVGSKNTLTLEDDDNAFAYDKLRGETAKTSLKVNYSVVNGSDVQLLDASKTNIVNVTQDANGKITKIQATGYGSGTVYIIASVSSFSPVNPLFNTISTTADMCTLTVVVRKVDADIALSVGSPFSLDDLHYGDKVEITGVTTTYDGVTLKKVDGTTPMYSVSELNLTATNCSIPTGNTQTYLCLTNASSTTTEVYVTAAVSGNAIVKPISSKKISFAVGKTDQAIATKDFSVLRTRTAVDNSNRDLKDYFCVYDKRHSSTTVGGEGKPTFLASNISFNGKTYVQSVVLSLSNFNLTETGKDGSCSLYKLAELENNGSGAPSVKKYSETSGTVTVTLSKTCGNSNYNDISKAVSKSYNVRKHSPNIEFIVGGTTASSVADKNNIVTVDVTYGETVSLGAHSYNIASGKTTNFYDSNDDGDKSFTFTSSNTNVGTVGTNSFTALNVGTTDITITQTPNCKITTYSNLAGDATGVSADDTPNPNKWYRIQVVPATRTIAWPNKTTYTNLTSASPDITLDAYTKDKNGNPIVPGAAGTVTYSIESADVITGTSPALPCVQLSSDNKTLIINGSGTATIKVSFAKSNYAAVYDTWTINIADESPALNVTPSSGISITSTDDNVDMLKYFTITNYSGETIVKSVSQPSGKTDVLTITGSTLKAFKEDASVQVPCTVEVTSRYLSDGSHPKAIGNISFAITKGTLVFNVAGGGKWIDNTKWSRPDIVQTHTSDNDVNLSDYNVSVIQSCHIGTGPSTAAGDEAEWLTHRVNASCHNLTIDGDNAKLVIGEASTLRVVGVLNNTNASKLVLAANNWGQASVVFGSGTPMATVEMYLPAGNGNRIDPRWHYRGIAVTKESFEPITEVPSIYDASVIVYPWSKVHIYRWYEEQNKDLTNGCWDSGMSGSSVVSGSLEPWAGYAFANMTTDPVWLSYKGTLINANETVALDYNYYTYTDNNQQKPFANVGVNLITNSYAAPLLISQMGFSGTETYQKGDGSLEAGVVLYNSGSYGEWETAHSGSGGGNAGAFRGSAGQHSTVPKNTTEAVGITMIPSGQAFFVTAKQKEATLTLTYGNDYFANSPNTRMYLPGRNEEPEFNILKIDVVAKSDSAADQLIMLECDSCSRQYDNGYDGIKRFGDSGLPQLYAYNKYGITAVNADSTFNKQYVGFAAGSDDETYTISFETDRLFGYHSLYLVDRKMNESVDILAGETYSFKGYTVGENTRFQINGMTIEEWEKENEGGDNDVDDLCDLRVVGNTLFVEGFTAEKYPAARVEVFDMTGNMVWSTELTDSRVYDLPALPHGIYTIRLGDCHVKYSSI